MYIVGEPIYRSTDWYGRILSPLKAQARKKRVMLTEAENAAEVTENEGCAFVLGGNVRWIAETVDTLQLHGIHPIVLTELSEGILRGRFSHVRSDFHRLTSTLAARAGERGALYGVNPDSASDRARKEAFLSAFFDGDVIENNASLDACFADFLSRHKENPFSQVICTNEAVAVSLVCRLRALGEPLPEITVPSGAPILSFYPEIRAVGVDPAALARAAFAIADCVRESPDFIGVEITVDYESLASETQSLAPLGRGTSADAFYADSELDELLRLGQLFSAADETDLTILRLLSAGRSDIGAEAFLSDNGVKYRIKKMKRICAVERKAEITAMLEKYGIML